VQMASISKSKKPYKTITDASALDFV